MLFNSLSFAVFLPIVFALYWILPHRFRWILLLVASYYFYMSWDFKYIVLILFTTVVSYSAARLIEGKSNKRYKKAVLLIAAILCLGVLFFFKYFTFVSQTISEVIGLFSIKINPITLYLILPVGISFYTFQTLSYVIDVYRGDIEAEHHFGKYATFVSFFPQLVAGPIERSSNLLPQIKAEHKFDYELASYGLKQMAWGFFKKIVIADTISKYVGSVFDNPQNYKGFSLALAVGLFTIQIYCDFSGYSDIAIGTAKLMGIKLMTNFDSPYFSQSIKEFWSRWHISLSTWFRDYIYIPLGGNRVGKVRHCLNLLITFLISGQSAFNVYGDVVFKPEGGQIDVDEYFADAIHDIKVPEINDICVSRLNEYNNYIKSRGATLVIAGFPIQYGEYTTFESDDFINFRNELDNLLDCPVISDYTDYFYPYGYFYNGELHLTNEGAEVRTDQLILDLKEWMLR